MKGDFSRFTFHRERHYSGVLMQQGRVQLDADWNEQVDILAHLRRSQGVDVIGISGVPRLGGGFQITPDGDNLSISAGRIYVDGFLVENESPVWFKPRGSAPGQPHCPIDPGWVPSAKDTYLVFLDVWERHITALEDNAIREVALGGPDTATRTQTIWQVRMMPAVMPPDTLTCWDIPSVWTDFVERAHGRMSAQTKVATAATGPCVLPASAGYRRLENQLYRVEIHDGGPAGTATFKWSRDNGMVVTRLTDVNGLILTIADPGRDETLGFAIGQWIEISDDDRVLRGEPAVLVRVKNVVENTIEIEQWPAATQGNPPVLDLATATVRRWDQTGLSPSIAIVAGTAAEPVWIDLEDGVQVSFDGSAAYETGDYWLIPARTVSTESLGGDVEWPRDPADSAKPAWLPPQGIAHCYARLAIVSWDGHAYSLEHDCRPMFPALTEPDLVYVNGDGQEAMPGERLPQPLRVGVRNCNLPVEGAWVKLEILEGAGTLEVDVTPVGYRVLQGTAGAVTAFLARTDLKGELAAFWRLEELQDLENAPSQLVQATLLRSPVDDPAEYLDAPVLFGAAFGVAWENQYGGTDFPDQQHPSLKVITVEQALDQLRENVALYYVGGDGQRVAPGPRGGGGEGDGAAGLAPLPEPLELRVANGDWPYVGAEVRFAVEGGSGLLAADATFPTPASALVVATDTDGIARCYWGLDRTTVPTQRVTATLASAAGIEIVSPSRITFTAALSVADQITYDGSDFPDGQHTGLKVETVEEALDQLRENTALHYVSGDGQEVYPGRQLWQPLQVRVANGQWPRQGAQVLFATTDGTLQSGERGGQSITVPTDSDGLATCLWTPAADGAVSQQATATLVSPSQLAAADDSSSPGVICFNASLSRADQVYYDAGPGPKNYPLDTAQGAIDQLYATKVDRAGDTITGSLVIQGDLTVNGTTTTVNTDTLEIEDNIVRVNKYAPQPVPKVVNAGLEVFRGGTEPEAQVVWDEAADQWKAGVKGNLLPIAIGQVEPAVTGVVGFIDLPPKQEMLSDPIDPGLGPGPICVQCGLQVSNTNTVIGDTAYRDVIFRAEVNPTIGTFRIFATRTGGNTATAVIRWWAIKPRAGDQSQKVTIDIAIAPPAVTLNAGASQVFTASVTGTTNASVTWSASAGTITSAGLTGTYTAPTVAGVYSVTVTSGADATKKASATVTVIAIKQKDKDKDKDKDKEIKEKDLVDVPPIGKGPLDTPPVTPVIPAPGNLGLGSGIAAPLGRAFIAPEERPDLSRPPGAPDA